MGSEAQKLKNEQKFRRERTNTRFLFETNAHGRSDVWNKSNPGFEPTIWKVWGQRLSRVRHSVAAGLTGCRGEIKVWEWKIYSATMYNADLNKKLIETAQHYTQFYKGVPRGIRTHNNTGFELQRKRLSRARHSATADSTGCLGEVKVWEWAD